MSDVFYDHFKHEYVWFSKGDGLEFAMFFPVAACIIAGLFFFLASFHIEGDRFVFVNFLPFVLSLSYFFVLGYILFLPFAGLTAPERVQLQPLRTTLTTTRHLFLTKSVFIFVR